MQFKLVAIAGRKGHGKDTAAQALIQKGYTNVKFADALKGMFRLMLAADGLQKPMIERLVDGDLKELPIAYVEGKFLDAAMKANCEREMVRFLLDYQGANDNLDSEEPCAALQDKSPAYAVATLREFIERWAAKPDVTPRLIMQELGTEYGRVSLGNDLWTTATQLRIKAVNGPVVVTDMRFVNERDLMAGMGALLLRVRRPDLMDNEFSAHPSETAIDELNVHYELANDGTVAKLHAHITLAANNQKAGERVVDLDAAEALRYPNIFEHPNMRGCQRIIKQEEDDVKRRVRYTISYLDNIVLDRVA